MTAPRLTPLAVAALRVGKPERILVVGCGDGDAALFLAREFPTARVRGVDRDAEAIRAATARIGLDPEGRVAFRHAAGRALPFPDGLFDLVAAIDDGMGKARALARVLQPGGHLILVHTAPDRAPHGFRAQLLSRRLIRHGFGLVERGEVGDGGFAVFRLREGRSRRDGE